jgi:hypothetical protein
MKAFLGEFDEAGLRRFLSENMLAGYGARNSGLATIRVQMGR